MKAPTKYDHEIDQQRLEDILKCIYPEFADGVVDDSESTDES